MVLAALVLIVAFSVVCSLNYQQSVQDVYTTLSATLSQAQSPTVSQIDQTIQLDNHRLGANDLVPQVFATADGEDDENSQSSQPTQSSQSTAQAPAVTTSTVEIGGDKSNALIPVAVYLAKPDGTYTALGDYASASIQHTVLLKANAQVLASNVNHGELSDVGLFFEKRDTSNGTLIAYADTSVVSGWQQLAFNLMLVGVAVLVAFFLINLFFSWWALKPVDRAWRQQTQFVADASHELKTPLTVILANMAILRSHPDSTVTEQSQWVESTQTEAERMQVLVNDMLEMARPENAAAAAAEATFEEIDFSDVVESEVLQFESVAFDRGVMLESQLEPEITLEGDAPRLQRMVSTLIDNACKYANDGGQVDVKLSAEAGEIQLSVHNTGPEIPEDDLPYVFDRFYRADKARTSGAGGFGLGLAIAREIAREHGGDIVATSSADEGTTFTVTLPI